MKHRAAVRTLGSSAPVAGTGPSGLFPLRSFTVGLGLLTLLPPALAAPASPAEVAGENFVTIAGGATSLHGDRAQFQKQRNENKSGWGGLESFHYTRDLGNNVTLTTAGRALVGNRDFQFDFHFDHEDTAYLHLGVHTYRVWFDGSGGAFHPNNLFFALYDDELHLDRGDVWVEFGTKRPDQISTLLRYDYLWRRGQKNSTIWGDTNLTGGLGTRAIVPAFMAIREHRHVITGSVSREDEETSWQLNGRYENQSQNNARHLRRQPQSTQDRVVTQRERADVDLFMVHGSFQHRLGPTLSLGAGVAHYKLDNTLSGSRIYGDTYDPVFSPTLARRQYRDEGFYDLSGTTHLKQTLANLNLMYTPGEHWTVVPELRAQRNTWGGEAEFIETNVGAPPTLTTLQDELMSESGKSFRELTEAIEVRYRGFKHLALNASAELTHSYGRLAEDLIELETGVDLPYRTTDYRRDQQKVEFTAHWYPQPRLNFSAQYYWKGRQNSFRNTRTSNAPAGADRYPAYITHQDLEIHDFNLRASWSPLAQVRAVTRYDYQDSTLRSQEIGLAFIESGHIRTHMFSETLTWSPLPRWYVQASGNLVFDQTATPARDLTGPAAGMILHGDNNYFNGDVTTGYAVDDRTDLTLSYSYYRADNFIDNSARSLPYGAEERTHFVSLTWLQRMSPNLQYTVRYVYGDHEDITSRNHNDFTAHTVYASVQYRF